MPIITTSRKGTWGNQDRSCNLSICGQTRYHYSMIVDGYEGFYLVNSVRGSGWTWTCSNVFDVYILVVRDRVAYFVRMRLYRYDRKVVRVYL